MASVLFEEQVEIPLGIKNLDEFRQWARSNNFPQRGRIDYVVGRIEVDMSPEDIFTHGTLKTEVASGIRLRANQLDLGHTLIAETRISNLTADLSAEPDVMLITHGRSTTSACDWCQNTPASRIGLWRSREPQT